MSDYESEARGRAAAILQAASIALAPREIDAIEVTDFGLGRHPETGLQLLIYVNSERYCAKEMVLFPGQTCPEHLHPPFEGTLGKQETLRVRFGTVYLYVPGEAAPNPVARPYRHEHYSVWHEITLKPGDEHTIPPLTKHWFFSPEAAVISEFSTQSKDVFDLFTDPQIVRVRKEDQQARRESSRTAIDVST